MLPTGLKFCSNSSLILETKQVICERKTVMLAIPASETFGVSLRLSPDRSSCPFRKTTTIRHLRYPKKSNARNSSNYPYMTTLFIKHIKNVGINTDYAIMH